MSDGAPFDDSSAGQGNAVERFVLGPARATPDGVALVEVETGRTTTRAALAERVGQAAAAFAARGVQPEQRVVIAALDRRAFLEAFWGAMWIGAVPVPVSTMLTERDCRFQLDDARAVAAVVSPELTPIVAALAGAPHLRALLTEADLEGARAAPPPLFPSSADDDAFWLYTSGTTGAPKAARHRHADLHACTEAYARGVLDMGPGDRCYSVAKLFFAYGLGNAGYFPAGTGATALLSAARPDPAAVARHVEAHGATLFFAVPTFYAALLRAEVPPRVFARVRLAVSAGEALPAELLRRFEDRYGVTILDGIGTTELGHIFLSNRPGDVGPGTSGRVVPGYEVELRDAAGRPVPDGELGDLWVAGESVTVGYWRRTARNREVLAGRFMKTGDVYVRTPDGRYVYQGRSDDMLKVGGIWVSPAEVEACIVELEDVLECAVVGREDDAGLVKPHAFVVPRADAAADALAARVQAHVKARLAPYKYPRWVDVVAELPKTATGKIRRFALRAAPHPRTD